MSSTLTSSPASASLEIVPSSELIVSLFRMNVDQYERLVDSGVLDDQQIELINGFLVRKMGKKPPHVIASEAARDELLPRLPQGWRLIIEAPVRIPDFDEPEPDLGIVRGTREEYADHHPEPADVGLLIEVADTTLERDRGEKGRAYARGGVPVYWIVNLVDRQLEIYTEPGPDGYRGRRVLGPTDQAWVTIGEKEIGPIAVAAMLPQTKAVTGDQPLRST